MILISVVSGGASLDEGCGPCGPLICPLVIGLLRGGRVQGEGFP